MSNKNSDRLSAIRDDHQEVTCPACGSSQVGSELIDHRFPYGDEVKGIELTARVPLRECSECDEQFLDSEAEDLMHDAVCRHLGVMCPAEVRSIRKQSGGLSQSEFASLTRLGAATIGRWERGQLIQNAAYDQFLYLLTFPENMIRLRGRVDNAESTRTTANPTERATTLRALRVVTDDLKKRASVFTLTTVGAA